MKEKYHTVYFNDLTHAVNVATAWMYGAEEVCFKVRKDAVGQREGMFEVAVDRDSYESSIEE